MYRLKELRKNKGLTQEQLGTVVGVSKRTIIAWENSERPIKASKAEELADFFNVDVGYLVGLTNYRDTFDRKIKDTIYKNFAIALASIDELHNISVEELKNLYDTLNFFNGSVRYLGEKVHFTDFFDENDTQKVLLLSLVSKLYDDKNFKEKIVNAVYSVAGKELPTKEFLKNAYRPLTVEEREKLGLLPTQPTTNP